MEAFFRGSHTTNFVTWGFNRSYSQAAEVPSSNVTCKSPRSPSKNCRIMLAFVSITHSITIFPEAFMTAIEILSLCTSMPIYLVLVIKGCSFLEGLSRTLKTYSKSRLLRNEGGKKTRAMFRVPEHRFFVLGRQIHVIVGGSRIRWPAGLHAACVRRECSACVSDCRRLRPS